MSVQAVVLHQRNTTSSKIFLGFNCLTNLYIVDGWNVTAGAYAT
jgi:hypothetical protein